VGLASKPTPSASISVAAEVNLPEAYTNFDPTIVASGFEPYQPYKLVFWRISPHARHRAHHRDRFRDRGQLRKWR
jgi:hypothetical protein